MVHSNISTIFGTTNRDKPTVFKTNKMKTQNLNLISSEQVLEFHIGRGGRFFNAGHLTYNGMVDSITSTSAFNSLFAQHDESDNELDEFEYFDGNGNGVELTKTQAKEGTGTINIDNDYDTTYCIRVSEVDENQMEVILRDTKGSWEFQNILFQTGWATEREIAVASYFEDFERLLEECGTSKDGALTESYISDNYEISDSEPEEGDYFEFDGKFYTK